MSSADIGVIFLKTPEPIMFPETRRMAVPRPRTWRREGSFLVFRKAPFII